MKKNYKARNPVAQALYEDRKFRLKVENPKKRPPPEVTVSEAYIVLEEEDINEEDT